MATCRGAAAVLAYLFFVAACQPDGASRDSAGLVTLAPPACHSPSDVAEIGKPSSQGGNRLVNGWSRASGGSLATSRGPRSSILVQAGPGADRLALRFTEQLSTLSASIGSESLESKIEGATVFLTIPPSLDSATATIDLEIPFGSELVAARLLPGEFAVPDAGWGIALLPGGRRDCFVEAVPGAAITADIEAREGSRVDIEFTWRLPQAESFEVSSSSLRAPFPGATSSPAYFSIHNRGHDAISIAGLAHEVAVDPDPPQATASPVRPSAVVVYVMDALQRAALEQLPGTDSGDDWQALRDAGFEFQNHHSVAPNTLPSTKALFTGKVWAQGGGRRLPESTGRTLAEDFASAGFLTAMFSNNPYVSPEFGVDRGFDHVFGGEITTYETENTDSADIVHAADEWLSTAVQSGQPVFLYLHVLNPHNPYTPPPRFTSWIAAQRRSTAIGTTKSLLDLSRGTRAFGAEDTLHVRDLYVASTLQAVESLGVLRESLRKHFLPEQTLLVVTSDHGEELGEHGSFLHGYTLFEEMLHVPALLHWPGSVPPGRSGVLSTTLDLECYLRSIVVAPRSACSMHKALLGVTPATRLAYAAAASLRGGVYSVRGDQYKFIFAPQRGNRWGMGSGPGRQRDAEYLFDLVNDPTESSNLLAGAQRDPKLKAQADMLRIALQAWVQQRETETAELRSEHAPPAETVERLEALGYVNH